MGALSAPSSHPNEGSLSSEGSSGTGLVCRQDQEISRTASRQKGPKMSPSGLSSQGPSKNRASISPLLPTWPGLQGTNMLFHQRPSPL